jgi:hypothetical protein
LFFCLDVGEVRVVCERVREVGGVGGEVRVYLFFVIFEGCKGFR